MDLKRPVLNIMRHNPPINLGQLWHKLIECQALPDPEETTQEVNQLRAIENCQRELVKNGAIGIVEDKKGEILFLTSRTSLPSNRIVV